MKSALNNTAISIDCASDGIKAELSRKKLTEPQK